MKSQLDSTTIPRSRRLDFLRVTHTRDHTYVLVGNIESRGSIKTCLIRFKQKYCTNHFEIDSKLSLALRVTVFSEVRGKHVRHSESPC